MNQTPVFTEAGKGGEMVSRTFGKNSEWPVPPFYFSKSAFGFLTLGTLKEDICIVLSYRVCGALLQWAQEVKRADLH